MYAFGYNLAVTIWHPLFLNNFLVLVLCIVCQLKVYLKASSLAAANPEVICDVTPRKYVDLIAIHQCWSADCSIL